VLQLSVLYSVIENLCKGKNITVTDMCRETGVPRAVLSELKSGRSKSLTIKHLETISKYFGISIDAMINAEKEKPAISDGLGEYDNEIAGMVKQMTREQYLRFRDYGEFLLQKHKD
jgi:transcriptional regulator with XRE-family HTH domain